MNVLRHGAVKGLPVQREAALEAFRKRRVFEECAGAIPGFVQAFLLPDPDDPDAVTMGSEWRDAADFDAATRHPVREAQTLDRARLIAVPPPTRLVDRHG